MPVDSPNFLTPTGEPGDERIDEFKRWLAGDITMEDPVADNTELVMVLKAASDHIYVDLDVHADSLIRQVTRPEEYGPVEVEGGDKALKRGRKLDWKGLDMGSIVKSERDQIINVIEAAKEEIEWLTKQIRRLENFMQKAKTNHEKGLRVPLVFETDERDRD